MISTLLSICSFLVKIMFVVFIFLVLPERGESGVEQWWLPERGGGEWGRAMVGVGGGGGGGSGVEQWWVWGGGGGGEWGRAMVAILVHLMLLILKHTVKLEL